MKTRKIVAVGAMLAILVASYFSEKAPAAVRTEPSLGPTLHSRAPVHAPLATGSGHSSVTQPSSPMKHSGDRVSLISSSAS
jgi:hypothetical protein